MRFDTGCAPARIVNATKSCPPKERAVSTKPTVAMGYDLVEASPSRVFRCGEGTISFQAEAPPSVTRYFAG
jgi:hypothetical protein